MLAETFKFCKFFFTLPVIIIDFINWNHYLTNMKETLLYLRELNHYSQSYVAKYLGISRQMYSKYENGEVDAGVKSVVALSRLYKVPYDVIIENKLSEKDSVTYKIKDDFNYDLSLASPSAVYSAANVNTNQKRGYYYSQILSLLPHLVYSEELDLLAKLAKKVEIQTEKVKIENHAKNISEKDAEFLFEHFSGLGHGLDFDAEKKSYLSTKHLHSDKNEFSDVN